MIFNVNQKHVSWIPLEKPKPPLQSSLKCFLSQTQTRCVFIASSPCIACLYVPLFIFPDCSTSFYKGTHATRSEHVSRAEISTQLIVTQVHSIKLSEEWQILSFFLGIEMLVVISEFPHKWSGSFIPTKNNGTHVLLCVGKCASKIVSVDDVTYYLFVVQCQHVFS